VPDACCGLRREKVATGGLEEFRHCLILKRGRIGEVDYYLRAGDGLFEPLAGDGVDARVWRRGNCLMPFCFSFSMTFDPIKPVPPTTTIFMTSPLTMVSRQRRHQSRSPIAFKVD
jgi:hypothetical protein